MSSYVTLSIYIIKFNSNSSNLEILCSIVSHTEDKIPTLKFIWILRLTRWHPFWHSYNHFDTSTLTVTSWQFDTHSDILTIWHSQWHPDNLKLTVTSWQFDTHSDILTIWHWQWQTDTHQHSYWHVDTVAFTLKFCKSFTHTDVLAALNNAHWQSDIDTDVSTLQLTTLSFRLTSWH